MSRARQTPDSRATTPSEPRKKTRRRLRGSTPDDGPPPYDASLVGAVASRVEIVSIELLESHFDRQDVGPLGVAITSDATPQIGLALDWEVDADRTVLGCAVTFAATFDQGKPYELFARFRATYALHDSEDVPKGAFDQFAHWNAVFNLWPYWREYLSSTMNRAQLPRFVVPVMAVPRTS